MNNELTQRADGTPAMAISETELMQVLENSLYPGASPQSIKMAIGYCRASGLDPMQKPVHIVPIWDQKAGRMRDVIMPGIGLYRTQAARGGQYAGVTEPEFGPDVTENVGGQQITYPNWCKVVVKRRLPSGEIVEFAATERWKENYASKGGKEKSIAPNSMWSRRPYAQLAKCAEAQALRKAFPEVGSQPTADEMDGKPINEDSERIIPGDVVRQELPPSYTADQFAANVDGWRKVILDRKKTPDAIIAMVCSRYTLSDEQKTAIRNLAEPPAHHEPNDQWIAAYDAAEEDVTK